MDTMAVDLMNQAGPTQTRIIIADDQPDVLEALRLLLKGHGYTTEAVTSPAALLEALGRAEFDLVLMDLNYARDTTSGREGLDILNQLMASENAPPIVVMTGWATVGLAVEAMQRGVGDFVEKPWVNARLLEVLQKQIEIGRERRTAREWQPARVVGGDYYDVLGFPGDTLGLCIADVAGKGMPAALLMSNLQAAVRGLASPSMSPEILCERLNSMIYKNIACDRLIAFFYAHLDGPSGELSYSNAGHNAPIIAHRAGTHHRLDLGGTVLGIFPSEDFELGTQKLLPGDRVLLFTDGVAEACGADGEEFGDARLVRLLQENCEASADQLQKTILQTVGSFCGGNWDDDATLVVIAVN